MRKIFGTDGIRGIANLELTVNLAFDLGKAGALVLAGLNNHKPKILIGTDTRISSDMFVSAIEAGLCSMGADVIRAGVVTTPAVAYLTKLYQCDAGIMVSASHNTYEYNGIKFFNRDGFKLDDDTEHEIERILEDSILDRVKTHNKIGRVNKDYDCRQNYIDFLKQYCPDNLEGLRILLDCANGSASDIAPKVFENSGCKLTVINNKPNGVNINEGCGSTQTHCIAKMCEKGDYDIAFAYDGDADRLIAVDETGQVMDGDVLIAVMALYLKKEGLLQKDTVVITEFSNMQMEYFAKENQLNLIRTNVGDRYVVEEMMKNGYTLGGEQSGHILLLPYSTSGDGILASLVLLKIMSEKGIKASSFFDIMRPLPQTMLNVRVDNGYKQELLLNDEVKSAVDFVQKKIKEKGRVVLRPSGTEPVIRIMIEGQDITQIELYAQQIAQVISNALI